MAVSIPTNRTYTAAQLIAALQKLDPTTEVRFGTAAAPAGARTCWCGCGAPTKNRFAVGHDAKFHGLAKKVAAGTATMPTSWHSDEARADFMKVHSAKLAEIAAKAVAPVVGAIEVLEIDDLAETVSE